MDHSHPYAAFPRQPNHCDDAPHQHVIRARKKKKFIVGISLDLKAAYDSVYIDGLIMKCAQLGIAGRMLL